jgi:hypothetical protein
LAAFQHKQNGLARPDARTILTAVPTPTQASRFSLAQLRSALKRAGRQRGVEDEAARLREVFRVPTAHQPLAVEEAFGKQLHALLKQLDAACVAADDLAQAVGADYPSGQVSGLMAV